MARILRIGWILLPSEKKQTKNFYKKLVRAFGIVDIAPIRTIPKREHSTGLAGDTTRSSARKLTTSDTDNTSMCNMVNTLTIALTVTIQIDTTAIDL